MRAGVWIDAARPKTLGATIAPVTIGAALAYQAGHFEIVWTVVALLSALCIQIGTNFCNDYCDYKKGADAQRVGPVRATQAGLVTPTQMKRATQAIFLVAILLGVLLVWRGGAPILVIGVLSVLFGALYTAGPYPLAYIGLGDLFVLVFFGPVAVAGTYYVNALEWSRHSLLFGFVPGLISVAILVVNNLRDYQSDAAANKRTLVVTFGPRFGRIEYACCVLIPAVITVCSARVLGSWGALIGAVAIALWGGLLVRSLWHKNGAELGPLLPATNAMLLATALLISLFMAFPL
jgi:1,4-dihydroxy-2-naphthoate octaprenyltransferase